jgi:pSer/pThr/pTyr-binding forkhead associated (FHA) protein
VIGGDPQADLVLEHKDVCPRHAYLQLIEGRLYCIDLGSRSGIALGGKLQRAGWLEPQQSVRIGPYRIRLAAGEEVAPGSAASDFEVQPVTLELSHRGFKTSECTLSGVLSLVGSATDSQVRLLDPGVSNTHCSLVATGQGLWVVDLLGKSGIQVDGRPVRYALLDPGDELHVGRSAIRIRQGPQDRESAPAPLYSSCLLEESAEEPVLAAAIPPPSHFEIREVPVLDEDRDTSPERFPELADVDPGMEEEPEDGPSSSLLSSIRRRQIEDQRFAELSAQERRASCRYPVTDAEAVLSWWEPIAAPSVVLPAPKNEPNGSESEESIYRRVMARWPGSHQGTPAERAALELARDPLPAALESMQSRVSSARFLDISQTGALVLSEAVPPSGERLWLRLETPQVTDWVEVVLKGSTPHASGAHRVRLAFREACPYDIFKAVVYTKPGS